MKVQGGRAGVRVALKLVLEITGVAVAMGRQVQPGGHSSAASAWAPPRGQPVPAGWPQPQRAPENNTRLSNIVLHVQDLGQAIAHRVAGAAERQGLREGVGRTVWAGWRVRGVGQRRCTVRGCTLPPPLGRTKKRRPPARQAGPQTSGTPVSDATASAPWSARAEHRVAEAGVHNGGGVEPPSSADGTSAPTSSHGSAQANPAQPRP